MQGLTSIGRHSALFNHLSLPFTLFLFVVFDRYVCTSFIPYFLYMLRSLFINILKSTYDSFYPFIVMSVDLPLRCPRVSYWLSFSSSRQICKRAWMRRNVFTAEGMLVKTSLKKTPIPIHTIFELFLCVIPSTSYSHHLECLLYTVIPSTSISIHIL